MSIAPIVDVVGEQIRADAERLHATKQRRVRHLAMLQRMPVIRPRHRRLCGFDGVECKLGRLIAIGVDVKLNSGLVVDIDQARQFLRRNIPQAVRGAVVIARPAQPSRKSLDRTVHHKFHDAIMKLVVVARPQRGNFGDGLFRRIGYRGERRHQPHAKVGLPGHLLIKGDGTVDQIVVQVGNRGHTLNAGGRRVTDNVRLRQRSGQRIAAERAEHAETGGDALQLAACVPILADHDTGNVGSAQQIGRVRAPGC